MTTSGDVDYDNLLPNFGIVFDEETQTVIPRDDTRPGNPENNWGDLEGNGDLCNPFLPGFMSISDHLPFFLVLEDTNSMMRFTHPVSSGELS